MSWLNDLQSGVFKTILLDDSLARLEESGISVRGPSGPQPLAEVKMSDFSPVIHHRATQMQHVYVAFFCLENAVRELIVQPTRSGQTMTLATPRSVSCRRSSSRTGTISAICFPTRPGSPRVSLI